MEPIREIEWPCAVDLTHEELYCQKKNNNNNNGKHEALSSNHFEKI